MIQFFPYFLYNSVSLFPIRSALLPAEFSFVKLAEVAGNPREKYETKSFNVITIYIYIYSLRKAKWKRRSAVSDHAFIKW